MPATFFHENNLKYELHQSDLTVRGVDGQQLHYDGATYITLSALGITLTDVPVLVVSGSNPCLIGTNVMRELRRRLLNEHGTRLMNVVQSTSEGWHTALLALNQDGVDMADENGVIGQLRYR